LAAILFSVDTVWQTDLGGLRYRWVSWFLALTFAPTLFLLFMGQISGLLLLGAAGFLHYGKKDMPIREGLFAALTAWKPHHLSLFKLVLALDSLRDQKARRAVIAGGIVIGVCSLIPLAWNANVWQNYRAAMKRPPSDTLETMEEFKHSTIGYELRLLIPGQPFAAMFIPVVIAMVVTVVVWHRRRDDWPWEEKMPWLIIASILVTLYGARPFDMVLLLLPLDRMAAWPHGCGVRAFRG